MQVAITADNRGGKNRDSAGPRSIANLCELLDALAVKWKDLSLLRRPLTVGQLGRTTHEIVSTGAILGPKGGRFDGCGLGTVRGARERVFVFHTSGEVWKR